jgi:hypothetical protein
MKKLDFYRMFLLTLAFGSSSATEAAYRTILPGSCGYRSEDGSITGTIEWHTTDKGSLKFTDTTPESFFYKMIHSATFDNSDKFLKFEDLGYPGKYQPPNSNGYLEGHRIQYHQAGSDYTSADDRNYHYIHGTRTYQTSGTTTGVDTKLEKFSVTEKFDEMNGHTQEYTYTIDMRPNNMKIKFNHKDYDYNNSKNEAVFTNTINYDISYCR